MSAMMSHAMLSIRTACIRIIRRHSASPRGLSLCAFNDAQVHGICHCGVCQQFLHSNVFPLLPEYSTGQLSVTWSVHIQDSMRVTCKVVCCMPVVGTLLDCVLSHTALIRRGFTAPMPSTAMLPV